MSERRGTQRKRGPRRTEWLKRRNISSGAPWEKVASYSRAVRVGQFVEVAGTAAVDEKGKVVAPGDAYRQSRFILKKIARVLAKAGAAMKDVVRTRIYVTDIGRWKNVARAHSEAFRGINPAATMVEVRALIDPQLIVEIEVTAILQATERH